MTHSHSHYLHSIIVKHVLSDLVFNNLVVELYKTINDSDLYICDSGVGTVAAVAALAATLFRP